MSRRLAARINFFFFGLSNYFEPPFVPYPSGLLSNSISFRSFIYILSIFTYHLFGVIPLVIVQLKPFFYL